MSTLQIVVLSVVIDSSHEIRIDVHIIVFVFNESVATPRAFPELIQHSEILVCLAIPLIVFDWRVDPNSFESGFLPGCYDVPNNPLVRSQRNRRQTRWGRG